MGRGPGHPSQAALEFRKRQGENLRFARKRADITAVELVKKIALAVPHRKKISTAAMYAWEAGRNTLPERLVPILADILGCSIDWLMGLPDSDIILENLRKNKSAPIPTMDQVRELGHKAFLGVKTISAIQMDEMLLQASSPDWPPE